MITRRNLLLAAVAPKPKPLGDLTAYLQKQIDDGVIPGVKVIARLNDEPFVELLLGTYCDQKRMGNPTDLKAWHHFASVSKMVSATAVMMAVQDGLLSLDDAVSKYIPEFGAHGKEKITIRQCMTHSAGIPTAPKNLTMETEEDWNMALKAICDLELEWEPGSRTLYHGLTGPFMASACVRRRMGGKTWQQICKQRIFDPLRISSLTFEMPPANATVILAPPPEKPSPDGVRMYAKHNNSPGSGLKGTAPELLKFLRFHTRGGVTTDGRRLLTEKLWTEMHTHQFPGKPATKKDAPGFDGWGLGMMLRAAGTRGNVGWLGNPERSGPRVFSHAGISTSLAVGDPDAKLELVILTTGIPAELPKAAEIRRTSIDGVYAAM